MVGGGMHGYRVIEEHVSTGLVTLLLLASSIMGLAVSAFIYFAGYASLAVLVAVFVLSIDTSLLALIGRGARIRRRRITFLRSLVAGFSGDTVFFARKIMYRYGYIVVRGK